MLTATGHMLPTTCCQATCCPGVNAALVCLAYYYHWSEELIDNVIAWETNTFSIWAYWITDAIFASLRDFEWLFITDVLLSLRPGHTSGWRAVWTYYQMGRPDGRRDGRRFQHPTWRPSDGRQDRSSDTRAVSTARPDGSCVAVFTSIAFSVDSPHIETRFSSSVTLSWPSSSSSFKINDRSFRYASPCLWNKLPASFRQPNKSWSFFLLLFSTELSKLICSIHYHSYYFPL